MSSDASSPWTALGCEPSSSGDTALGPMRLDHIPSTEELTRVVALDGPAGTGKSSVAKGLAQRLGWAFVDTGATYRAATLAAQTAGVDLTDAQAVLQVVSGVRIQLRTDPGAPAVLLDGVDVSARIREAVVTEAVSTVSAIPAVRALMIDVQRHAAGVQGAVIEGRDIATVVAPHAQLKVYLDARPEVRAQRRAREIDDSPTVARRGLEDHVERALNRRDALDSQTNRLEPSEGAVHLDTSDLELDAVIEALVELMDASPQEAR